jgi:two-component system cell cycle sensor histidine kinase/response regulator CckA
MNTRYLEKLKKNKLVFVNRCLPKNFLILFIAIIGIFLCSSALYFITYLNFSLGIRYSLCITIVLLSAASLFCLQNLRVFIKNAEFQNMLYSNSIKSFTNFYLIAKTTGEIIYQDDRLLEDLAEKIKIKFGNLLSDQKNVKMYHSFYCMEHLIEVKPMTRPKNYFVLICASKKEDNIYQKLLRNAGIYQYAIETNTNHLKVDDQIRNKAEFKEQTIKNLLKSHQIVIDDKNLPDFYTNYYCRDGQVHYGLLVQENILPNGFLESFIVGSALLDSQVNIKAHNAVFEKQFAKDINVQLKKTIAELEKDQSYVINLQLKDQKMIRAYISPVKSLFIGFFIDLTELKLAQEKLQQSQKIASIGKLAGGIAHDFNNILTAIIGFADILLHDLDLKSKGYWDIAEIKSSAQKGKHLVKQILAFARDQKLKTKTEDVNLIIQQLQPMLKRLLPENIDLRLHTDLDLKKAKIDKNQFEQCIINLVINAKDAISVGGKIAVKTQSLLINQKVFALKNTHNEEVIPQGRYLKISVADNGCGIENEVLKRIFDPFFSTKEVGSGTGLGLCTTYGIIKQMDGYIDVTSQMGVGSEFSIFLPASYEEIKSKDFNQKNKANIYEQSFKNDKKILLVEDEEMVRKFINKALTNKGFFVSVCSNASEALKLIPQTAFDLVITDVVMPGLSGPEMVEEIKKQRKDIKVIFISGYTRDKLDIKDIYNDSYFFIEKPFELEALFTAIAKIFN